MSIYLLQVVQQFSKTLVSGTKYIHQTLPKLLTLWLDYATPDDEQARE